MAQETMMMSLRLYLDGHLELGGLDVEWSKSPKAMMKDMEEIVSSVMVLLGEDDLPGFNGFSTTIEGFLSDVEELDERDLARIHGMDRSIQERFYTLVRGRVMELELQLSLEIGAQQDSGLWSRIGQQGGFGGGADGAGSPPEISSMNVPNSRQTRSILEASDDSAWPGSEPGAPRLEVVGAQVDSPTSGLLIAGSVNTGLIPASQVPVLAEMQLPDHFDVPFAVGSAVLDLNARMQLAQVRDLLVRFPRMHIVCTGHADATGLRISNEELSRNRALAVRSKLLESGVSEDRVLMNYFGEEYAGWVPSKDRRVEVTFLWSVD